MPSRGPLKIAGQTGLDPRQFAFPEVSARPRQWWSAGLALSLLLHSLPLLALIGWQPHPVEIPKAIAVELVMAPPPAPPIPEPPPIPQRVRTASADMAEKVAPKLEQGADSAAPPASEPHPKPQTAAVEPPPQTRAEPERPAESQAATTAPPPQPEPAPSHQQAEPAEETKTAALTPPVPKPTLPKRERTPVVAIPMTSAWPLPLQRERERRPAPTPRFAAVSGPSAIRDEYCVRALNLTLRHLDLLPRSYVGDRRGRTVVAIRILGDGTINSVKLLQSSGFADLDQRVERMVFAVGQYPPLPLRMAGPWMDFSFIMVFPEAVE